MQQKSIPPHPTFIIQRNQHSIHTITKDTMECTTNIILLFILVPAICSGLIVPKPETELYLIRARIELLTQKVHERCPDLLDHGVFLGKRDLTELHDHTMEMERELYRHMKQLYDECYSNGLAGYVTETSSPLAVKAAHTPTTPITKTSTSPATTTTTTTTPKTTALPLPPQCTSSATPNLTESWRNNYSTTDLRNEDIDILLPGVTWFRFTGAAGNLMRNSCPPSGRSCRAQGGYWSDSPLPTRIGETVNITFYEKLTTGSCDDNSGAQIGRATRCSADRGGVVYIMDVVFDSQTDTVCGMD